MWWRKRVAYLDITDTVFPVVAMTANEAELARPDFFGTAFGVAPGVFMTAAHVAEAESAHGQIALAGPTPAGPMGARRVDDYEVFPDRDLALLFCRVTVTPLKT